MPAGSSSVWPTRDSQSQLIHLSITEVLLVRENMKWKDLHCYKSQRDDVKIGRTIE